MMLTYQAARGDSGSARKRMRTEDTFFNEWLVPVDQLAQMTKMTSTEHDSIFALVTPLDEEAKGRRGDSDGHRPWRQSGALP